MTTKKKNQSEEVPHIEVLISKFPLEGALAQMFTCNGVAGRLRRENPCKVVRVVPWNDRDNEILVRVNHMPSLASAAKLSSQVRASVQDSLDRANKIEGDSNKKANEPSDTETKLLARQRQLETALRGLVTAAGLMFLFGRTSDGPRIQGALAEAQKVLDGVIVKDYTGGGLTFDEVVRALKNIGYDLTCGQCAAVFYTGSGTYPHDPTCTSPK